MQSAGTTYTGRFAPSPTGPLHAGSLVAALASWLDARAHGGRWLVRMEDVDTPRCVPGMEQVILKQLADCGLTPDEPPVWQSQRTGLYQQALDQLVARGLAYACACSRKDIEAALARLGRTTVRHGELVYPGTCRTGLQGRQGRAWRLRTDVSASFGANPAVSPASTAIDSIASKGDLIHWVDRRLGPQQQDVQAEVGDFVLKRADGLFAYQLAVVVDDAAQGITDVVRGEDLVDNTARQILLQQCLGLPTPRYLHTPLVLGANGEKLSKQSGAQALDTTDPLAALNAAAGVLGLPERTGGMGEVLGKWVGDWGLSPTHAPCPSLQSCP
ncbi:tRNA glutamyl-Q(34) synthetase GluQRS [Rhodoferax sp.]|uniref:tRNA glutamyl-Q(34) synthetase GluQRS n=1 Tax=Rhodoferax sp. TaxID=50421 RepID=UPI001ED6179B|nr:tRNA glutamyl-Q(34) synthetase GluQRS [Rhodoferax sp.]MBT9507140.1 tRNA glutamyl-Q(34) synthetase GluQRS [Rhodoferax sp.]